MGKLAPSHKFPFNKEKIESADKTDLSDYLKSLIKSLSQMWDNIARAVNTVIFDHGSLEGLADDDHAQYHTDARGDARYYTEDELDAGQLDTRYYTETELDAGQLDNRYYTEDEIDAKGFVDRGDPVNPDWAVGNFTADGAWHNLDCSAIVPEGAKGIVFGVYIADDVTATYFQMRKDGNVNTANANSIRVIVAGASLGCDSVFTVPCSTARFVEYRATNGATFLSLSVWVIGWFI